MYLAKQMGIALAVEAAYATDQIPTAALNAVLAENVKLVPMDGDEINHEHVRPGLGGFEKSMINKRVQLDFDISLRGSGVAGAAPAIASILRAVGFSQTLNVGVSAVYKLVSSNFESATIYLFRGNSANGVRHRLIGARGSWKFGLDVKKQMVMSFSIQGLYVDPNAQAMPVNFDYTGFTNTPIVPVNKANTTFTLGGYAAILEKLDIDSGLAVAHRPLINYESIDITDRSVTGSMTIQEPNIATKDFFSTAYPTPEVMVLENGLTPGQIIRIDSARVQRAKPDLSESNGVAMLSMPLAFLPSTAGDDNDLILTFK